MAKKHIVHNTLETDQWLIPVRYTVEYDEEAEATRISVDMLAGVKVLDDPEELL